MGFVCMQGHFIAMNLAIPFDEQYRTVCHCGMASILLVEVGKEVARDIFNDWIDRAQAHDSTRQV